MKHKSRRAGFPAGRPQPDLVAAAAGLAGMTRLLGRAVAATDTVLKSFCLLLAAVESGVPMTPEQIAQWKREAHDAATGLATLREQVQTLQVLAADQVTRLGIETRTTP